MGNRRGRAPLEVDGSVPLVDVNDLAGETLRARIVHLGGSVNCMVLGRKAIAMNHRPLLTSHFSHVDKSSQGALVLLQLVVGKSTQPEVLPPGRLVLPPVPFQHLSQEPPCPMLVSPFCFVWWQVSDKTIHEVTNLGHALLQVFAGFAWSRRRPRQGHACFCPQLEASLLQPIPQTKCREAVITVVAFDGIKNLSDSLLTTTQRQHGLERLKGQGGVPEWHGTSETVEGLHFLDRIAFD